MSLYDNFSESQIKQKIMSIIRTFRSLGMVTDSDVKIDEMQEKDDIFEVKGEYRYRPMYQSDSGEQGTFTIALDRKLQPKNIKIIPTQKRTE